MAPKVDAAWEIEMVILALLVAVTVTVPVTALAGAEIDSVEMRQRTTKSAFKRSRLARVF